MSVARLGGIALAAATIVATLGAGAVTAYANHEPEGPDGPEVNKVVGTRGPDRLTGTKGDDLFSPHGGHDRVFGYRGWDVINPSNGDDVYRGQAGFDLMHGGRGVDRLYGGPGFDLLVGGRGADALRGGEVGDVLLGGRGPDRVLAGRGADLVLLTGDGNHDDVYCGPGKDTVLTGDRGLERLDRVVGCEEVSTIEEYLSGPAATSRFDATVTGAFDGEVRRELTAGSR